MEKFTLNIWKKESQQKEFCGQATDSELLTLMVIKMRVIYHQFYTN